MPSATFQSTIGANIVEKPKEQALNKPTPFNGDKKEFWLFLQACRVYFSINKNIYNNNEKKAAFILSYMIEKEALT